MTRLLIMEDDALIGRMYEKAFSFEKFEIQVADNGQEGLEKLKSFKPDLILLDIMMPKMNGLEVLDALKKTPNTKGIPVIMLTNMAGKHDVEEALKRGAVKYIIKGDHTPKEVVAQVKEVLAGYTRDDLPPVV